MKVKVALAEGGGASLKILFTDKLTDKQTDGHGDSIIVSAQWGRFS